MDSRGSLKGRRLALAALACTAALAGCGDAGEDPPTVSVEVAAPAEAAKDTPDDLTAAEVEAAPSAAPPAPETTLALDAPDGAYPVVWVRAGHEVEMRTE